MTLFTKYKTENSRCCVAQIKLSWDWKVWNCRESGKNDPNKPTLSCLHLSYWSAPASMPWEEHSVTNAKVNTWTTAKSITSKESIITDSVVTTESANLFHHDIKDERSIKVKSIPTCWLKPAYSLCVCRKTLSWQLYRPNLSLKGMLNITWSLFWKLFWKMMIYQGGVSWIHSEMCPIFMASGFKKVTWQQPTVKLVWVEISIFSF